jgi:hypothetical protein
MAYPVALPAMAALSIAGAAVGVQLGRSAIAEINPVYFSTPQARFFADLTPKAYRLGSSSWSDSTDYRVNELNVSGRGACLDCSGNFVEPETVEAALPDWDEPTLPWDRAEEARNPAADPTEDPDRALRASQIERYASFPAAAEEALERTRREADLGSQGASLRQPGQPVPGSTEEQTPVGM